MLKTKFQEKSTEIYLFLFMSENIKKSVVKSQSKRVA